MASEKTAVEISVWQDRLGRGLMILAAVAAIAAFASGLGMVRSAAPDRLWVETWRMLGFLVFAGLFTLLAWRPRLSAGVWELVFLNKAALVVFALIYKSQEALSAAPFDAVLVALLVVAYIFTRGWRSWRKQDFPYQNR